MLANLDLKTFAPAVMCSMLSTLYGFVAAAGFLIADVRNTATTGRSSFALSEEAEQAKKIIDNVVERL